MVKPKTRLHRFRRDGEAIRKIALTVRDKEVIRQVARFRFLRSQQICNLVKGASAQILRRLQALYHHGYLDRPRCQIDFYHRGGSHPMVYGLAKRGAALMRREFDIPFRELEWTDKPNSVGRIFLEHTLMVAEGLIAVQTTCLASKGAVRYLSAEELGVVAPFRWNVTVQVRRLGLVPDGVFGLEYRDALPEHSRVICFLEADRGTMPITRSNPHLSCFARKLDAYMALWKRGEFEKKFGTRRVAVHTVTETAERASNIAAAVAKLPQGRGLFACHVLAEITPIATAILQHASPRDKNLKSC